MIKNITITDFIGLGPIELKNLNSLTVFIARNNSGKTYILDYIYDTSKEGVNYVSMDYISFMFSDREVGVAKEIIQYRKKALDSILYKFNQSDDAIKEQLLTYFGYLTGIELDYHEGEINHFIEKRGDEQYYLEFDEIGSAYMALFATLVEILWNDNNIILIDEPELGLHADMQKKFFNVLKKISKGKGKQLFIATHSHLFLDRLQPRNNFKLKKNDYGFEVHRLNNQTDVFVAVYQMLGNSPGDVFMPSNFMIVEGESDKIFFVNILRRFYSDKLEGKTIIVQPASGDITNQQVPKTLSQVSKLYSVLQENEIYRDRAVVFVDKQRSDVLKDFKRQFKITGDRLYSVGSINKYALENMYPPEVITRIIKKKRIKTKANNPHEVIKKIQRNRKLKKVVWAQYVSEEIEFDEIPKIVKDAIDKVIELSL